MRGYVSGPKEVAALTEEAATPAQMTVVGKRSGHTDAFTRWMKRRKLPKPASDLG
jgi:hypothetical protein